MMTNSGSTDYSWRVNRTVFLNTLGYSPISSQKEVEEVRKRIMTVNKEDWAFLKMNIYQNKQGKLTFANFTLPSGVISYYLGGENSYQLADRIGSGGKSYHLVGYFTIDTEIQN